MATLAVVPALPVHKVRPERALLTAKFVEGMTRYTELWDGPVVAVMHPEHDTSTGNLDDTVYELADLPFDLRCANFTEQNIYTALDDADVVMLGGDHRLAKLPQWCRDHDKHAVFVTEYTLRTRLQIVNANSRNPIIRLRRYLWEWQQEQRNRRGIIASSAVQCNGTPTYDAYREINDNTLLYFDSRITADMLITPDALGERQQQLRDNTTIRLAFSGRLNAMKGADHLLDVALHLRQLGVPFTLDIYGDGELRPAMEQRMCELKLQSEITFRGVLDFASELLPEIARTTDLFVCCHRQGDPSCTYLETYACGVPVVGYANEALVGLTRDRQIGWTTPMDDPLQLAQKIADLYRQRDTICAAGSCAREFAAEHTFDNEFSARIRQLQALL